MRDLYQYPILGSNVHLKSDEYSDTPNKLETRGSGQPTSGIYLELSFYNLLNNQSNENAARQVMQYLSY